MQPVKQPADVSRLAASHVRRHRLALSIISVALISYAIAGFFLVPHIARTQLQAYASNTLHRQISVSELRFNPFTLTAQISDFHLSENDGTPLIAFSKLLVNAELASLWQRAINLKEVRLDAPEVQLIVDHDGKINLMQLSPQPSPESETKPDATQNSAPPRVRIGLLAITSGRIGITDLTHDKPFSTALAPIKFTLTEFKTDLNYENAYHFSGITLAGEQLEWSGEFTVQPLGSNGRFTVNKLKAATVGSYLSESLPFTLASGEINLAGQYHLALNPTLALDINLPSIGVRDLSISDLRNESAPLISLSSIDVADVAFSYPRRTVAIKSVALRDAHIDLQREVDGSLNLSRLFSSQAQPNAATSNATAAGSPAAWQARVDNIQVTDSAVTVVDNAITPAVRFELQPIALTLNDWSTAADATVRMTANIAVNKTSFLNASGSIQLTPMTAAIDFKLSDFSLASLQPYISKDTQLTLHKGTLNVQGNATYIGESKPTPSFKFAGDVRIDNLRTTDNLTREDFVKWQRLAIKGISASGNPATGDPDKLSIESIVAREPYARVVIAANQTTNVSHVLSAPDNEIKSATTVATQAQTRASKQIPIRIKRIQVIDGSANFADYSIQPNFATGILDLNGSVTGLSSDPASRAQIKLEGKVDRYAPVDIDGEINVLSATTHSDVTLNFSNMELTTFNPYSGKFAGYNITKGKLSTQLHYRVEDRALEAQHHIVVDNLEFGEKTDSKDAAPIPLKFAVALLRDRNGVIDLNLPVTGSLDDPKFRLAPIIWHALGNVLTKVVAAPFTAIGALFGGGDELAYVEFEPGSAIINTVETDKLKKLAQGMVERPQLHLNVPLTTFGERDSDALAMKSFTALLPSAIANAPDDSATNIKRLAALEAAWKKLVGTPIAYPSADADEPKLEPTVQVDNKLNYLQSELLRVLKPDANALTALARERANAVQATLLANPDLNAQRVFLTNERPKEPSIDKTIRMQLALE